MKKQFIAFFTLMTLTLSLTGCGSNAEAPAETTDIVVEEVVETNAPEETPVEEETIDAEEANQEETEITEEAASDKKEESTETAKPNSNTNSSTSTSTQASTSKPSSSPSASTKPSTNAGSSTKPSTKPSPSPSTTPSTSKPSPSPSPEVSSLSAEALFNKAVAGIEFPAQMTLEADMISDMYSIDISLLDSYMVKVPLMSAHMAEVAVFKVKNANDVSKVVEGINKRAADVGQMLYPSLQETYDSRQLITNGNYVLFVMDKSAASIVSNFNAALK